MRPRQLLKRHSIRPKKSLGQNFLVDKAGLRRIVAAAELSEVDTVLEIGPGLGTLTRLLAAEAGSVVAVELDGRLIPILQDELAGLANVKVIQGDILDLTPGRLLGIPSSDRASYKVVANLPYYITGAILRHLLENPPRPQLMVLTVQREVAARLVARPGRMSLLAVSVQYYGRVRQIAQIKAGSFYPRPAVDSAIIRIDLHQEKPITGLDDGRFFRVVRAGFGQKRKQLRNSLAAGLGISAELAETALNAAAIDHRRRAETLSLAEWGKLTMELDRVTS